MAAPLHVAVRGTDGVWCHALRGRWPRDGPCPPPRPCRSTRTAQGDRLRLWMLENACFGSTAVFTRSAHCHTTSARTCTSAERTSLTWSWWRGMRIATFDMTRAHRDRPRAVASARLRLRSSPQTRSDLCSQNWTLRTPWYRAPGPRGKTLRRSLITRCRAGYLGTGLLGGLIKQFRKQMRFIFVAQTVRAH